MSKLQIFTYTSNNCYAEYGVSGQVSTEGDMYSYGILLLEMFTGRRPTDSEFQDGHTDLHNFVRTSFPERVMEIIDQSLLLEADERGKMRECIIAILKISVICSMESPKDRMEIRNAGNELHLIRNLFLRRQAMKRECRRQIADTLKEGTSNIKQCRKGDKPNAADRQDVFHCRMPFCYFYVLLCSPLS